MIEFDEANHRYRLDGRPVPSVTQALEPFTGLEFVDRETLRRAAEFGSHVHQACHLFNMDVLDMDTLDPALAPYVAGWAQFLRDTGATVILSEYRVASSRYGYAGTFDALVYWGKSQRLIDIKSGSVVPRTVGPQLAAYAEAYHEMHDKRIRDRYCIHLPGEGRYQVHRLNDPRDWHIFHSALNLHKWYERKAA